MVKNVTMLTLSEDQPYIIFNQIKSDFKNNWSYDTSGVPAVVNLIIVLLLMFCIETREASVHIAKSQKY